MTIKREEKETVNYVHFGYKRDVKKFAVKYNLTVIEISKSVGLFRAEFNELKTTEEYSRLYDLYMRETYSWYVECSLKDEEVKKQLAINDQKNYKGMIIEAIQSSDYTLAEILEEKFNRLTEITGNFINVLELIELA